MVFCGVALSVFDRHSNFQEVESRGSANWIILS